MPQSSRASETSGEGGVDWAAAGRADNAAAQARATDAESFESYGQAI